MSLRAKIADYLALAEDLADAIDTLLEDIDPDDDDPDCRAVKAALYGFRHAGLELHGQADLTFPATPVTATPEAA